jgi:hypothetical protein
MDILENFDFGKALDTMYHLDWRWYDEDNGNPFQGDDSKMKVSTVFPSENRMRRVARKLLISAAKGALDNETEYTSATGGLRAEAHYDPELGKKDLYLRLSFVVTDWDNYE